MATKRPPQSALGNPPLNHIQEDLLHLLAGLLALLEPEFASSRGARRMPRAQRSQVPMLTSFFQPPFPPCQAHPPRLLVIL